MTSIDLTNPVSIPGGEGFAALVFDWVRTLCHNVIGSIRSASGFNGACRSRVRRLAAIFLLG